MEKSTLQVSKEKNISLDQQLKLIDGKFSKSEALSIVNNVVDVKINFHKLQRLSKTEGNIHDKCLYDNTRITELINDKAAIKEFLLSLDASCKINIASTIHISVEQ